VPVAPGDLVTAAVSVARPGFEPHIFERFYRADSARDQAHGGSGIELTIARALITAHEGTLTAASDGPGTGTQLTITLQAAAPVR
jgi:two-component system, OmpR family, sensor histidine kinase BaeS